MRYDPRACTVIIEICQDQYTQTITSLAANPTFCVQVDGVMPVQVRHLESNTKKVVETLKVTLSLDTDTFHWKAGTVG